MRPGPAPTCPFSPSGCSCCSDRPCCTGDRGETAVAACREDHRGDGRRLRRGVGLGSLPDEGSLTPVHRRRRRPHDPGVHHAGEPGPAVRSPASATPAPAARIETTERVFFGRPNETIAIPGTYHGVTAAATLRIQLRVPGGWEDFPLAVVTQETGSFQAYVELGRGEYRLRLVDPATGTTSKTLTLLLL